MNQRQKQGKSHYGLPHELDIDGVRVEFDIDEINYSSNGAKVYYHRIGKKKSKGDLRLAIYRQALLEKDDRIRIAEG